MTNTTYLRTSLLALALAVPGAFLAAQSAGLNAFNQKRLQRTEQSMWVLGAWGAANIAVGAIGMSRTSGTDRAFHQMNLGWGAVNLGLAASGLWTALHTDPATSDLYQTAQEHHKLQKIFLFNAGLDAGYIMAGLWMQEKAKTAPLHAARWKGFGRSIMLQGAFLMAFDLGAFLSHRNLNRELKPFFQHSEIGFSGNTVQWVYRF
ncbi:MAG: DUF6992 family protein [Saprospiraceae bacterium]